MCVYEIGNLKVVDLSKALDPASETRRCNLFRFNTGGPIPDFHTIMDITSHLGTHVECPYHHHDDWPDATSLPLTSYMGRAQYVNFSEADPNSYITPKMLDDTLSKRLLENDIVILDSPFKIQPFTSLTNTEADKRMFINGETAQWMVNHHVKGVGFGDGVSIENRNEDVKPFHDICMAENIVFLEVLENLEYLQTDTFFISFAPLPIKGIDACPVRAYAIEGLIEFQ